MVSLSPLKFDVIAGVFQRNMHLLIRQRPATMLIVEIIAPIL